MKKFYVVIVCMVAAWGVVAARAQNTTGDILGTVTDASGNAVASAKVTVINTGTHVERTTTTGTSGDYVVNLLQPGAYSVTVSGPGFRLSCLQLITLFPKMSYI